MPLLLCDRTTKGEERMMIMRLPLASIQDMTKEQLLDFISDLAKRWLAHDGLWFQASENKYGLEAAIELDTEAWKHFTINEAKRIMQILGLKEGGGLEALARALNFRLYAFLNQQTLEWISSTQMVFKMTNCRVQAARNRKQMADFPCKSVGLVEYTGFAQTIDPRIKTRCLACPPDAHPAAYYCAWEFTLE